MPKPEKLRFAAAFKRSYKKKSPRLQKQIDRAIVKLQQDPWPNGLRVHKIRGTKDIFEARIDGGCRLTFQWDGSVLVLRFNCSHDEVLKLRRSR